MIYKALSHLEIGKRVVVFHCINPFTDDKDKKSPTVRLKHTVEDIPQPEKIVADIMAWAGGALIQDALPYLYPSEREILLTGFLPEDWENMGDLGE